MKILWLLFLVGAVIAKHEAYIGWKSYYVSPQSQEQLQILGKLEPQFDLDFIRKPSLLHEALVLVKPQHQAGFIKALEEWSIDYSIHSDDVVKTLNYEDELIEQRSRMLRSRSTVQMPYDNYQPLEVYDSYIQDVAKRFPDKATLVSPARSFEGRPIYYLKISTTNFEDHSKPVIFIDGLIHAREWIAGPVVTWAIHKLLEDVTEPDLLERFDWVLLPVVNPDGYDFTHTTMRMWRKTRSNDTSPLSANCPGVDGNRNFDFAWGTVGVEHHPCSEVYPGDRAFSEIETRVVKDIIAEHLHRMALYITMHSVGPAIIYPWGHDGSLSWNGLALHTVGIAMADAIHSVALPNFFRYTVGNAALVYYAVGGGAEDYAHAEGVPLSYTFELPGHFGGFHLPPQYIEQVCRETWAGVTAGARRAGDLFTPGSK